MNSLTHQHLGYFHTHDRPGTGIRPPMLSREPMTVSSPARRRSKALDEISPKYSKDFKIDLKSRVKVGQRSNFDASVWWSPGPAISIAFARNSVKVTSKGYWRYPVSISAILSTGQGQGQFLKGHEGPSESKIFFRAWGKWFIVTFTRKIQKLKPFCNLTQWSQRQRKIRSTPVT